ncbi:MAG: class I SAM-dependent methyltransferase [Polyangiaceae bacterium]|jgi:2-polyprenyl-3-methyl-5-hydroxy-6-metoxy-1,4-benzoquinol methylase|nr:class I SAM-dependent methyltransferase [Polyangiaceae bacterium]
MRFMYQSADVPDAPELVQQVSAAAERIYDTLMAAGPDAPDMDPHYKARYYHLHFGRLREKLTNSAHHVLWALSAVGKSPEQAALVDHGGGLGFISLLAKAVGVGKVIYNDIDAKFADAARGIANVVAARADQYIVGDVEALLSEAGTAVDALVSYDVLEHIYDLDAFFAKLGSSAICPTVIFASSGANMFSPRCIQQLLPIQKGRELLNQSKRINIIRGCAPTLSEDDLVLLCRRTRMLVRRDIEEVVERYVQTKKVEIPKRSGANAHDPYHSNTVDPESGWWAEHLINPYYLTKQLRRYGYSARIKAGPHEGRGAFLNPVIKALGAPLALSIAPYYTLFAVKNR